MEGLEIGKVLSEQYSELLKKFTTYQDRADVSFETGVGISTLREITYRNNAISERSLPAVKLLFKSAADNADETVIAARRASKKLKAILHTA